MALPHGHRHRQQGQARHHRIHPRRHMGGGGFRAAQLHHRHACGQRARRCVTKSGSISISVSRPAGGCRPPGSPRSAARCRARIRPPGRFGPKPRAIARANPRDEGAMAETCRGRVISWRRNSRVSDTWEPFCEKGAGSVSCGSGRAGRPAHPGGGGSSSGPSSSSPASSSSSSVPRHEFRTAGRIRPKGRQRCALNRTGSTSRSGLLPKFSVMAKPMSVTCRSSNQCWMTTVISPG